MTSPLCKLCGLPVDFTCDHPACLSSHERGYCSIICDKTSADLKALELKRLLP